MNKVYHIDSLTPTDVILSVERSIDIGGTTRQLVPSAEIYNISDVEKMHEEIPEDIFNAIIAVWYMPATLPVDDAEIISKYILHNLSSTSVVVNKVEYVSVDGKLEQIAGDSNKLYINSTVSRVALEAEVPGEYVNAILSIWGDTATVAGSPEVDE